MNKVEEWMELKKTLLFSLMGLAAVTGTVLTQYKPLGKKPKALRSPNLVNGKFQNQLETPMRFSSDDMISMSKEYLNPDSLRKPSERLPVVPIDFSEKLASSFTRIYWLGHSAMLVQMDGKTMLVDPMFGRSPSPLPFAKNERFSEDLPFELDGLPDIDVVLLTHDHYDHLDYATIQAIQDKVAVFIVPLGVGSHLKRWGVGAERIVERDWGETFDFGSWTFVCTPARHFSGRSLTDRNATLWASWVVLGETDRLFFSGDGGYGPHFKEIGDAYGPFDFAALECGQYDERWPDVHMQPSETAQAFRDVRADKMLPIHWGAFTLSFHAWFDPAEQMVGLLPREDVLTPRIGERITLDGRNDTTNWWRDIEDTNKR